MSKQYFVIFLLILTITLSYDLARVWKGLIGIQQYAPQPPCTAYVKEYDVRKGIIYFNVKEIVCEGDQNERNR